LRGQSFYDFRYLHKFHAWKLTGKIVHVGRRKGTYRELVGKLREDRLLGRVRRRWEDNIKMRLEEVGCEVLEWIDLGQKMEIWCSALKAVMNIRIP